MFFCSDTLFPSSSCIPWSRPTCFHLSCTHFFSLWDNGAAFSVPTAVSAVAAASSASPSTLSLLPSGGAPSSAPPADLASLPFQVDFFVSPSSIYWDKEFTDQAS